MSGMNYSGPGTSQEMDDQGPDLPGYVPYLSLAFKLIAPAILLLSGSVVYTIKTTRSLHKPHNIFVINLLTAGMIVITIDYVMAATMITSFALGVEFFFVSCYIMKLRLIPYNVVNLSYVIIAADKVRCILSSIRR